MDLKEIGWGGMDWIDLAQDRDQWQAHVNTVMHLQVVTSCSSPASAHSIPRRLPPPCFPFQLSAGGLSCLRGTWFLTVGP
jgi:hypothetical protein